MENIVDTFEVMKNCVRDCRIISNVVEDDIPYKGFFMTFTLVRLLFRKSSFAGRLSKLSIPWKRKETISIIRRYADMDKKMIALKKLYHATNYIYDREREVSLYQEESLSRYPSHR